MFQIRIKNHLSLLIISIFFFLLSCSKKNVSKQYKSQPAIKYKTFTSSGAWCWFSDPRAVYYEGEYKRTYATWVSNEGSIQIGLYDHGSDTIRIHTLHENFEKDDHANPSLYIDEKGKIMVFYSRHCGTRGIFKSESREPEQITKWEARDTLSLNPPDEIAGYEDPYLKSYTYPNPCYLKNEDRLYLFWRGAGVKPNMAWSEDHVESWTQGKIFIEPPDAKYQRPYVKVNSNGKDKIHFAFTNGHPRQKAKNSIYYAEYHDGAFNKANGKKICNLSNIPFKPEDADLVYNAKKTSEKAWIWDIAITKENEPVIVYARFPDDSNHVYYYAHWDGQSWQNYKLVKSGKWFPQTPAGEIEKEPNYSGGVVLDHENPNIVYLSRNIDGVFEIEKWETQDNGKTWKSEQLTKNSKYDNVRPVAVRNQTGQKSPQLLWMRNLSYLGYRDYQTEIKMDILK